MNKEIVVYILILALIFFGLVFMWYKGKKKWVLNTIYILMLTAEGLLGNKKGQDKLGIVLTKYRGEIEKLPKLLKSIVLYLFPENKIKDYVNYYVPKLNMMFREKYDIENDYILKLKKLAFKEGKELMLNKALKSSHGKDKELVSNISLLDISDEINIEIDEKDRGYIKGFTELETNFKKANLKAGIQGLYKF